MAHLSLPVAQALLVLSLVGDRFADDDELEGQHRF
jgi:hypothetical protein